MARGEWIGCCGLLGVVLIMGVGGVGPFDARAWAQQPPKDLHVSVTVQVGYTSRDVGESGNVLGSHYTTSGTADSTRLLVTLAYSPIPEVTIYAVGGGATLQIDEFDGYSSSLDGMYGGGLTLSYNVLPMAAAYVDGRYLRYVTDDTVVMQCGPGVLCPSGTGETITWNEYRLRFGLKSRMPITTYGGLQVSLVRAEDHINHFQDTGVPATLTLTEKNDVGVFGGISIPLDPLRRIRFFTEFNLFDEYAIRGGLTYSM